MVKVIIPIGLMNEERWDRYRPQLLSLSKYLDELHICAEFGCEPKESVRNIFFHFYRKNVKPRIKSIMPPQLPDELMGFKRIIMQLRTMKKFAKMINKINVDLIYGLSSTGFMQFAHIEMKKIKRIPAIYRMRGYGFIERELNQCFPLKEANDALDLYTSSKYDLYIPIKKEYVNILKNRGVNEKRICDPIINGVDINLFKPIKTPTELTIGYAGRISKEKGINFLSDIMECTKNINYLVAGKKQMRWKTQNNCKYFGLIPHKKMVDFYNQCNVIVLPSYTEGVSNVILEAYACGRVLIMSENARPPEIPNFGWELPHDARKWKNLIESIEVDDLIERGMKAREWVKDLSWDKFGMEMVFQFKRVVNAL